MKKIRIGIIILAFMCLILLIIPKNTEKNIIIQDALGTSSSITIYDNNTDVLKLCRDYIYNMDKLFSTTNPNSEISKLNSGEQVKLSPETKNLLNLSYSWYSDDDFNPFCGSLTELWDAARLNKTPPDNEDIKKATILSKKPSLKIDGDTAHITEPGQKITLGAVAKGYITNGIVGILEKNNITSGLVNLGGNIYAKGKKPDGSSWKIGIRCPDSDGEYLGIISVTDMAVITSGDYERYFDLSGIRYHHILDPKTGYPAQSGLRSVTILSKDAALADMLSTKCFIAGFERSKDILKGYDLHAIFVTDNNVINLSKELESVFTLTNQKYKIEYY